MKIKTFCLPILVLSALGLIGCLGLRQRHTQGTSVMQFLYPHDRERIDVPGVPVLRLPLRVGVAFVPSAVRPGLSAGSGITAEAKSELLNRVAAKFHSLPYVKSIEIIPDTYLRPGGGFENLEQIRSMLDVDVIALVAYDQTQFTNEGMLSFAYWTIVGAYVIRGEKNDTETLMEAVVYDIASHKLLFRAPGASQVKASATPINLSEQQQADSRRGLEEAGAAMMANLQTELEAFKVRIKESPDEFKVEHRAGYTGGGELDGWFALSLAGLALLAMGRRITCEPVPAAFPG